MFLNWFNKMAKIGEIQDISGQKFGFLTATSFAGRKEFPSGQHHNLWNCVCECGKEAVHSLCVLKRRSNISCGCKTSSLLSKAKTVHGYRKRCDPPNKTWRAWWNMVTRCTNPKSDHYGAYGGRGISIHLNWVRSFPNFLQDMGECPNGYSLERINVDGNYEPSNCKWIPLSDQFENMRKSLLITHGGKTQSLARWARDLGMNYTTLYDRHQRGDRGDHLFRIAIRHSF